MSEMMSFKVLFISITVTSWSFIELLFLTFYIAHIVMVIKMRMLSESFKWCSSILVNKGYPLHLALRSINPNHFYKVAIPQDKHSLLSSGLVILVVAEAVLHANRLLRQVGI